MAEIPNRPENLLPPLQIIDYLSLDKPDNYQIPPITPTSVENKENSIFEDWSGRGSHVDFTTDETVPLVPGRFLGRGVSGDVFETHCKGVALAWKTKFCRRKIRDVDRKEITILKKLSHNHIIKLVGTYTYRHFLGLLLWPVAICDMATFFEDFETILGENFITGDEQSARLTALGLPCESQASLHSYGYQFLYSKIGCLASAIAYLHEQKVRHKDLKPSNILLSRNNLWVTDFGTSTDFSLLSTSATENGERGTPKYFAPEVAAFKPNGRSADVFSLGCIFLEILTAAKYGTLGPIRMSRPVMDRSFQSNLNSRQQWLQMLNAESPRHKHILCEIEDTLNIDPQKRPTAFELKSRLAFIDQFRLPHETTRIFGFCCATSFLTTQEHADKLESAHIRSTSLQKRIDTLQAEVRKMRDEQELHMQRADKYDDRDTRSVVSEDRDEDGERKKHRYHRRRESEKYDDQDTRSVALEDHYDEDGERRKHRHHRRGESGKYDDQDTRSVVSEDRYDENGERRRSKHKRRDGGRNGSPEVHMRSSAASEPRDIYELDRKSKRRLKRDILDDNASVVSSPARYDEDPKSGKEKKSGGLFGSLFGRKSLESLPEPTSKSKSRDSRVEDDHTTRTESIEERNTAAQPTAPTMMTILAQLNLANGEKSEKAAKAEMI